MENEKLDLVLRTVESAKRTFLKKLVIGTAFAVPIIASYSVKDLAYATMASGCTATVTISTEKYVTTVVVVTSTPI